MGLLSTFGAASGRAFGLTRVGAAIKDAYFNLTTLLLPGNGTNGAQNNTFLDSSTNNFTITRNGNTTQGTFSPFSQTGWSNYFDGTDDYLSIADNAVLRPGTSNFTLEAWIWRGASGAAHTIYAKGGASTGIVFQVTSTNVLRFTHTTTNIDSTGTISANAWTHVAVVREGTGTNQTKLYINGTQDGQGTVSTDFTQTEEVRIGTNRGATDDFNGYISNLRFVKGTALYTGTFTPSTTPLTTTSQGATATEVELLTCQSNRFVDNSSNAFAITVNGTPSVQAFSPFAPTAAYSAATNGGSGYFDGTGDYLTVANNAAFNLGATFTIEFWIYRTSTGAQRILSRQDTSSPYNGFNINYGEVAGSYIFDASGTQITFSDSNINQWVHFAWVDNATSATVYRNGVSVGTATQTAQTPSSNTTLNIGRREDNSNFLNGYLAGLKIIKGTAVVPTGVPTTPPVDTTNTSLLLNFTNAGITDATAKNDLETVGNAQISTTQSKFGGSSIYFDGTGDYLIVDAPTTNLFAFGSGDFTVELWLYMSSVSGVKTIIDGRAANFSSNYFYLAYASTLNYYTNNTTAITGNSLSTNTWYHIAVCRSGTSTKLFIDGTQAGSTYTDTQTYASTASRPWIGADVNGGGDALNGYIDDLRVTKGYARYTSNFTPPTAPFPTQ